VTFTHPLFFFFYISEISFSTRDIQFNGGNKKCVHNCEEETMWNTVRAVVVYIFRSSVVVV
jgi:hypothetical protein